VNSHLSTPLSAITVRLLYLIGGTARRKARFGYSSDEVLGGQNKHPVLANSHT
jgi:hypothetical protein